VLKLLAVHATQESLSEIKDRLPFVMLGAHPDTGSEFINWHLKGWCDAQQIEMTRSRPYHKNDNAYVEQKNGHIVRRFLDPDKIPLMLYCLQGELYGKTNKRIQTPLSI
jgi:hypothetical protein